MTEQATEITLHQKSRLLEVTFSDDANFKLPFEFLRVYSPSAEVRGHSSDQKVLQTGKKEVNLTGIEPVGTYAVKLVFDDGHDTGLYSWEYLYELGKYQDAMWHDYLQKLEEAGASREPSANPPPTPTPRACGH